MSTVELSPLAELILNTYDIENNDKNIIKRCVIGYTQPEPILEKISWVIYRIFNAIKSLFGQSDRQIATGILKKKIINLSSQEPENFISLEKLKKTAEEILYLVIKSHETKEPVSKTLQNSIQGFNLKELLQKIENETPEVNPTI